MSDVNELKTLGNQALSNENYSQAVDYYTQAINMDGSNHILYSNRSAAYASWGKYDDALFDAKKTVELNPSWGKGYSRVATAYTYLKQVDEARKAYNDGLAVDPNNETLKKGLADLDHFSGDQMSDANNAMHNLFNNPQTRELFNDPAFLQKYLQHIQSPGSVPYDPKFDLMMNAMKSQFQSPSAGSFPTGGSTSSATPQNDSQNLPKTTQTKQSGNTKEPSEAEKEKELGNIAYKKKDFNIALEHYNRALEKEPINLIYMNNIAATYLEMKDYEKCIKECEKAVEIGREHQAGYKLIARALARIGTANYKMGQIDKAIEYYEKSLTEHRDNDIVKKLRVIQQEKKEADAKAYQNPEIAESERVKGNEFYSKGNFPEAIKHYTESIQRNPNDHRVYSNRAACFIKLMEFYLAIKDCDACIELDPKFVKAYLRKGHAFLAVKQIFQAQSTFETALEIDPGNREAYEGLNNCNQEKSKLTPEQLKEVAMKDPEIQTILTDPGMRVILEQMQNDPKATMTHLQNQEISKKIRKLIDAGIIQMR